MDRTLDAFGWPLGGARNRGELRGSRISDRIETVLNEGLPVGETSKTKNNSMAGRKSRSNSKNGAAFPARERLLWIYRTMMRIRRFEEAAEEAFRNAHMRGALHFYIGEERG